MSLKRTLAIARKEFRHIFRDPRTLFLVTISPAFLLFTLSYIFVLDVQQVDLAVWDLDGTSLSRQYVAALTADGDFRVVATVASYDELDQLLLAGQVGVGLVIPADFEADLRGGRPVSTQAVVDGVDPITARQAALALDQRSAAFAARLQAPASIAVGGLSLRSEAWYNPALKSPVSMVPGLTAIVLCMPALALALALTREKETGSFETMIVTPVRGAEYLIGKLTAYLASGQVGVLLVWLVAVSYFRIPFRGSFALYMLLGADYLLASMGFSLLIANFISSQQTAMYLILMIFFVPGFFVAGLISPIDTHSLVSQAISYSLPSSHFILISRGVFLKGLGWTGLESPILILLGMGLGGLVISLFLFRKRLQ
jgi:ABC-2 type transport system permease protein